MKSLSIEQRDKNQYTLFHLNHYNREIDHFDQQYIYYIIDYRSNEVDKQRKLIRKEILKIV